MQAANANEAMRQEILKLCSYDINEATVATGSRNVNYIISNCTKPVAIRISPSAPGSVQSIHSEILFADYVKEFVPTICQAIPFQNSLVNSFTADGKNYDMVVFRKGNGWISNSVRNPEFFLPSAKLMGAMHNASIHANRDGFRFKRKQWQELSHFQFDRKLVSPLLDSDMLEDMESVIKTVSALPKNDENYGMIHGDFGTHNTFVDWDDLWVFDFDDSCYHFYLYDIATLLSSVLNSLIMANKAEEFPQYVREFRTAYDTKNKLPESEWDEGKLNLFMRLRYLSALHILLNSYTPDQPRYQYSSILISSYRYLMH